MATILPAGHNAEKGTRVASNLYHFTNRWEKELSSIERFWI